MVLIVQFYCISFLFCVSDHIANVDNHRIKGLGVGKYYSEYQPPSTAPGVSERVPQTSVSSSEQINRIHQNLNLSSPHISSPLGGLYNYSHPSQAHGLGQVEGHGSSCSVEPASSIKATKGSLHSPSQTSMSQYPQQWSHSPSEEYPGINNM